MKTWMRQGEEPRLQEMLDDPVMRSMMASDGVTREELVTLVRCHPLVSELTSCDEMPDYDHGARQQSDCSLASSETECGATA
ncbi:hypothetical protein [Aquibaculum arenosum]|uniref:Uncharacterized protein n=1 Tax=Aquibaculum arenosum TaxID=3032591 RepID=A0ABT5YKF3_9PROT|nr:hypothetical protein [Fodinicurvata sp. CAU 1616]MDF2095343.1 hypothetical protein [Fodinicurvata sp. CAU 1616]